MRVLLAAVALSALSFVAGVAGDLARPANAGASVTVRIPPPIPADAPRAAPIISTPAAIAAEPPAGRVMPVDNLIAAPLDEVEEEHFRYLPAKQRPERVLRVEVKRALGHEKAA